MIDSGRRWPQAAMVGTLGLTRGLLTRQVLNLLGADDQVDQPIVSLYDEIPIEWGELYPDHYSDPPQVGQVSQERDWVTVLEPLAGRSAQYEVVEALSADGTSMTIHWDGSGAINFLYAVSGTMRRTFEAALFLGGSQPGEPLPEESGLFSSDSASFSDDCVTLVERLTGLALTDEWFYRTPRPVFQLGPL